MPTQDELQVFNTWGGRVEKDAEIFLINAPLNVRDVNGLMLEGVRGHVSNHTGTIIRATAKMPAMLMLDGTHRSTFSGLVLDGGGFADCGVWIQNSRQAKQAAGNLDFRNVQIANCRTGVQVGAPNENQSNCSEVAMQSCEIRSCDVGVRFSCDQAGQWQFWNLCVALCGTGIEMGSGYPNRGGFTLIGGSFGGNLIDFDLPSLSVQTRIQNLISEPPSAASDPDNRHLFLRVDPKEPSAGGRQILIDNVTVGARPGGKSILFRQAIDLVVRDSAFDGLVQLGNVDTNPKLSPWRIFEHCYFSVNPEPIDKGNQQTIRFDKCKYPGQL